MTSKFSKIQFGDGFTVTDEGGGIIRLDGGGGGGGGELGWEDVGTSAEAVVPARWVPHAILTGTSFVTLSGPETRIVWATKTYEYEPTGGTIVTIEADGILRLTLSGSYLLGLSAICDPIPATVPGKDHGADWQILSGDFTPFPQHGVASWLGYGFPPYTDYYPVVNCQFFFRANVNSAAFRTILQSDIALANPNASLLLQRLAE